MIENSKINSRSQSFKKKNSTKKNENIPNKLINTFYQNPNMNQIIIEIDLSRILMRKWFKLEGSN